MAGGIKREDAEQRARREFGNVTLTEERSREAWRSPILESILADGKYALRRLRQSPAFTIIASLTLTLGIGANTTIFSIVNAILFKPLPVQAPDELVNIYAKTPKLFDYSPLSYPDFLAVRSATKTLRGICGYYLDLFALDRSDESRVVQGAYVSGNYFKVLGVKSARGRLFGDGEDRESGGSPVAALSYRAWQGRFGGDPNIVGKNITLDGSTFTIIGVVDSGFHGMFRGLSPDVWVPMSMYPSISTYGREHWNDRSNQWVATIGRLAPGALIAQAQSELAELFRSIATAHPGENRTVALLPANKVRILPEIDQALYGGSVVVMCLVGLVLLVACANLAAMLFARAAARRKEMAVRLALGASRHRIVQQLLIEGTLLSLIAGGVAVLLTLLADHVLNGVQVPALRVEPVFGFGVDLRVLAFNLGVALVSATLFGLAPALKASRKDVISSLKDESSTLGGSRRKHRLLNLLVVGQVTLSVILAICAGLSVRSLLSAYRINPGFDPTNVATAYVPVILRGDNQAQADTFDKDLLERLGSVLKVRSC